MYLEKSGIFRQVAPIKDESFVGTLLGQTTVISSTVAPALSDEARRGGAREEERDRCYS